MFLTPNKTVTCIVRTHSRDVPIREDFPSAIQVEVTNLCNLRCPACPRQFMHYPIGLMNLELFKKIINQCANRNTHVKLYFLGESLLHPNLDEMILYAYSQKMNTTIITNGTLLSENKIDFLLNHTSGVAVSFDGTDAKTYEKRRRDAHFNQVYNNVKRLFELNALNPRVPLCVTTILPADKNASRYVTEFAKLWRTVPKFKFSIFREQHYGPEAPTNVKRDYICWDGLKDLIIRWDGNITYCCGDISTETNLGNAKKDKLVDIWRGENLREIHSHILKKEYDLVDSCRNCSVYYEREIEFSIPKSLARLLSFVE